MDKEILLQTDVQKFITDHEGDDLRALMLQKEKYSTLPLREIVSQISSRRKAEKKLPSWYQTSGILYPPHVSVEQASSEIAAEYKASLFSGKLALDLTSGFGVDSFYFAKRFDQVIAVEENTELTEISKHNFEVMRQDNISIQSISAETFIQNNNQRFDLIYIDPDRRPENKRVMGFEDSRPNILTLLPELHKITDNILIKASPMMDIAYGLAQLKKVYMVIVLAIENEVKELLFLLSQSNLSDTKIKCINITNNGEQLFKFDVSNDQQEKCTVGKVSDYLYEPNAAIMKVGSFNMLCKNYNVVKLNPNTHLFTSDKFITDFPGRKFKITAIVNYKKKEILPWLAGNRANIAVRNFIDTPKQVKKKLELRDGGDRYLFGFRDQEDILKIAICEKINNT